MDQNLPTRNQNPGDLKDPSTGTFRQFKTPQEGYAALLNDLQSKMTGTSTTGIGPSSTLADFARVYAPPEDKNNTAKYIADLANKLKVRPDATLKELHPRIGDLANAIAGNEGYKGLGTFAPDAQASAAPAPVLPAGTNMPIAPAPDVSQGTGDDGIMGNIVSGAQSFAKGLISPVLGIAATPLQAGVAGINALTGSHIQDPTANGIPVAGLGNVDVTPLDLEKKAGDVAQTAGYFVPGTGVMGALGSGALIGAGSAMSGGKGLIDTALQGAEGAALGGATYGATKLVGAGLNKAGNLLTGGDAEKASAEIKDAYTQALNLNASQRAFEKRSSKDLADVLMKNAAPLTRNEANNTLDASGAIAKLQEALDPLNQEATELLKHPQGVVHNISLGDLVDEVNSKIQSSRISQAAKNSMMDEAENLIKAEIKQYGAEVTPAVADEIKQGFWNSVFKKPLDSIEKVKGDTAYLAGNALKESLENVISETDAGTVEKGGISISKLKDINEQRSELIDAIKRLTMLDGVQLTRGGRLGHMAGGVVGTIAGAASGLGAPGAIIGDVFGTKAARFLSDPQVQINLARGKFVAKNAASKALGKASKPVGSALLKAGGFVSKGARAAGLIGNLLAK